MARTGRGQEHGRIRKSQSPLLASGPMLIVLQGDTHGSKAIPPRFKEHTKLVCARHSRSGRKKYVKKHPERVRKVPSRKLEGQGCPASISYKTYFDTEEVRACYISQHSHEIGLANLPFTRKGRKAAVEREKEKRAAKNATNVASTSSSPSASATGPPATSVPPDPPTSHLTSPQPMSPPSQHMPQPQQHIQHVQQQSQQQQQQQQHSQTQPQQIQQVQQQVSQVQQVQQQVQPVQQVQQVVPSASTSQQMTSFSSAVSMLAPLPNQPQVYATTQQTYTQPYAMQGYAPIAQQQPMSNERWDNMNILFSTIRDHARTFEYPSASVAALETVLIRLYLESPMGVGTPAPNLGTMMTHVMSGARGPTVQQQQQGMAVGGQNPGNDGTIQNHNDGTS
ncbi:hypothetical protein CC2G_000702 [Coprinopsis cinerea AmutBmut pab1-1]|nr:hypothetical protein CC2G_000702 [Coprinopsis cinerea AmutBmut pab1-1]